MREVKPKYNTAQFRVRGMGWDGVIGELVPQTGRDIASQERGGTATMLRVLSAPSMGRGARIKLGLEVLVPTNRLRPVHISTGGPDDGQ